MDRYYHQRRAEAEVEAARVARTAEAVKAHARLAELHLAEAYDPSIDVYVRQRARRG